MRVVDEGTLGEVDLETKAPEDQEAAKTVDDSPSKPVDEESSSPPPEPPRPEPEVIGPEEEKGIHTRKTEKKTASQKGITTRARARFGETARGLQGTLEAPKGPPQGANRVPERLR